MTPSSSSMDWFVLCSTHDARGHHSRTLFLYHLFSNVFMRFVVFSFTGHVSHVAVGNMHVRNIHNFMLLCSFP